LQVRGRQVAHDDAVTVEEKAASLALFGILIAGANAISKDKSNVIFLQLMDGDNIETLNLREAFPIASELVLKAFELAVGISNDKQVLSCYSSKHWSGAGFVGFSTGSTVPSLLKAAAPAVFSVLAVVGMTVWRKTRASNAAADSVDPSVQILIGPAISALNAVLKTSEKHRQLIEDTKTLFTEKAVQHILDNKGLFMGLPFLPVAQHAGNLVFIENAEAGVRACEAAGIKVSEILANIMAMSQVNCGNDFRLADAAHGVPVEVMPLSSYDDAVRLVTELHTHYGDDSSNRFLPPQARPISQLAGDLVKNRNNVVPECKEAVVYILVAWETTNGGVKSLYGFYIGSCARTLLNIIKALQKRQAERSKAATTGGSDAGSKMYSRLSALPADTITVQCYYYGLRVTVEEEFNARTACRIHEAALQQLFPKSRFLQTGTFFTLSSLTAQHLSEMNAINILKHGVYLPNGTTSDVALVKLKAALNINWIITQQQQQQQQQQGRLMVRLSEEEIRTCDVVAALKALMMLGGTSVAHHLTGLHNLLQSGYRLPLGMTLPAAIARLLLFYGSDLLWTHSTDSRGIIISLSQEHRQNVDIDKAYNALKSLGGEFVGMKIAGLHSLLQSGYRLPLGMTLPAAIARLLLFYGSTLSWSDSTDSRGIIISLSLKNIVKMST
jgi:hypothetical protein